MTPSLGEQYWGLAEALNMKHCSLIRRGMGTSGGWDWTWGFGSLNLVARGKDWAGGLESPNPGVQ